MGPPDHVLEAVGRALAEGPSRYTQVRGLASLREAICTDSARRRGVAHRSDEVVVSAGAKQALFNLTQALLSPGDRVLIPTPAWVTYAAQVRLAGAEPVMLRCSAQEGYALPVEALAAELKRGARALLLCSPNNPTGAVYDEPSLQRLAALLRDVDTFVVADEIYATLTYGEVTHRSLLSVAPDLRERIALVDGVSKRYAMTGYRVGWLQAPAALARACEAIQSQTTTCAASLCQQAAEAALRGPQDATAAMLDELSDNRRRLLEGLSRLPGVRCVAPAGAFYVLADVRRLFGRSLLGTTIEDDEQLAGLLLEHAHVAVVPGSGFEAPGTLRLSFATQAARLEEGLMRLARVFGETV